jgi:glycosyltransferase involved in cell wall biosynthesis/SAM-dependent methyltransferase
MQKKNKIVHIITRLDKGGSAENTLLTVLGTDMEKYEVLLFKGPTYESRMNHEEHVSVLADLKKLQFKGIKLVTIPFLFRRINPAYDLLAIICLYVLLMKEKPVIVHTHTSKAGILGRFAAKLARIPIVVHTPHGHVFFGYFGPLKTRVFILLEKYAARITDRIVALTKGEKEDYRLYKIAPADKIVVINSGIELGKIKDLSLEERQDLKRALGIPDKSLVVGTAGRLEPVKGPEILIEAAKDVLSKYPQTYFVFAGDGPLRQRLEKKALELDIKNNTIFLGWRSDVTEVISIYDIFAFPSLNEGMGRVLVEAMALGKPIVASDIGGIPDLVAHGINGFLVPPKNSERLAACIQILLRDKERRAKMGAEGKARAGKFGKDIMVESIAKLYDDLSAKPVLKKDMENRSEKRTFWKDVYRSYYRGEFPDYLKSGYRSETSQALRLSALMRCLACVELSQDAFVLDVGCGSGFAWDALRRNKNNQIIAMDIIEEPLKSAKSAKKDVLLCSGDAQSLPFRASSIDLVVAIEMLHYLDDVEEFLREAGRVLIDGAYFMIIAPNMNSLSWLLFRMFKGNSPMMATVRLKDLKGTFKRLGFRIIRKEGVTLPVMMPIASLARAMGLWLFDKSYVLLLKAEKRDGRNACA